MDEDGGNYGGNESQDPNAYGSQYAQDPNAYDPNQSQYDPNQSQYDPNQSQYDPNQSYAANPNQQDWNYDDPNYGYQGSQYGGESPVGQNRPPGHPEFRADEEYGEDEATQGVLWGYVMTPHGLKPARRITLEGEGGLRVTLTNYGARVTSIRMPDRYGISDEVLLGLDKINDYYRMKKYRLGCILGRMSRPLIGIQQPDGHHIFDELMWETCITEDNHVVFTLFSPTGEQGYPSDLVATADYWLEPGNRMLVRLTASCTAPTPLSLSLRLPFNLAGQRSGNEGLLQHRLMINARKYLEEDKDGTLTGEIKRSRREGLDFLAPIRMCDAFARGPYGGFDHHLILNGDPVAGMRFVARLSHFFSGRSVEIYSNSRCLHVDTLNNLRLSDGSNEDLGGDVDSPSPGDSPIDDQYRMHSSTVSTRRPTGRGPSWVEPKNPTLLKWDIPEKNSPPQDSYTEDPNDENEDGEMELGEQSGYSRSSKESESWEDTYQYCEMRIAEDLAPQSAVILAPEDYPDTVFDKEWTYTLLPGQNYERIMRFTFHRIKKPLPDSGWPVDGYNEEEGAQGELPNQPYALNEYPLYSRPLSYYPQYYQRKSQFNPQAASQIANQSRMTNMGDQNNAPDQSYMGDQSNMANQNDMGDQSNMADQNDMGDQSNMADQDNYGSGMADPSNAPRVTQRVRRTGEGDCVRLSDAPIALNNSKDQKVAKRKGGKEAAAPA